MLRIVLLTLALGALAQDDKPAKSLAEAKAWIAGLEKAEITFYKLDPNERGAKVEGEAFHGYPVLDKKPQKDDKELRALLVDPKSYGTLPPSCFDPGMGFVFKTGDLEADLVICLSCTQIVAYRGDKYWHWVLSSEGNARLRKLYEAQVPTPKK